MTVEPPELELAVDPDRMHQVLAILAANALRFGPPERPVRLAARAVENGVELAVTDEGPGIPESEVEHVFERFSPRSDPCPAQRTERLCDGRDTSRTRRDRTVTAAAVGAPQEPSLGTVRPGPSPRRLLAYAVVIGLVLDIGLRGGLANALITLAVGLTVRLLWTDDPRSGRPNGHEVTDRASRTWCDGLARKEARIIALAALVPALFLALRTSPWLAWSNASLIAALLAAAVIHARHGSILDSTPGQLVLRGASGVERGLQRLEVVRAVTPDVSSERRAHLAGQHEIEDDQVGLQLAADLHRRAAHRPRPERRTPRYEVG